MQNYYDQSPNDEALIATTSSRHGPSAADNATILPLVSFSSGGGGHEQEYKEESGIYMITMASVSAGGGLDSAHDSQTQATLIASKTVASVTSAAAAPQKATKRLIFQLDDQQRDTFDLEEKVYQVNHLRTSLQLLADILCLPISTYNQLHWNTITLLTIN